MGIEGATLREKIGELIVYEIETAMEICDGNRTHAARYLGIPDRTLRYWIATNPDLQKLHQPAPRKSSSGPAAVRHG